MEYGTYKVGDIVKRTEPNFGTKGITQGSYYQVHSIKTEKFLYVLNDNNEPVQVSRKNFRTLEPGELTNNPQPATDKKDFTFKIIFK